MKKFTLIELLIVIAIIGILVSMLLPSLSKARMKSRQVVCLSNQKSMYPAVMMFTDNNDDVLPWSQRRYGNADPHVWWKRQIYTFMGGTAADTSKWSTMYIDEIGQGAFVCPDDATGNTGAHGGGYGWNLNYLGWGSETNNHHKPKKIHEVDLPVETKALGDTSDDPNLPGWAKQMFQPPSHNNGQYIGNRHSLGINQLWVDGHATYSKTSVILSGKNGDQDYFYKSTK